MLNTPQDEHGRETQPRRGVSKARQHARRNGTPTAALGTCTVGYALRSANWHSQGALPPPFLRAVAQGAQTVGQEPQLPHQGSSSLPHLREKQRSHSICENSPGWGPDVGLTIRWGDLLLQLFWSVSRIVPDKPGAAGHSTLAPWGCPAARLCQDLGDRHRASRFISIGFCVLIFKMGGGHV